MKFNPKIPENIDDIESNNSKYEEEYQLSEQKKEKLMINSENIEETTRDVSERSKPYWFWMKNTKGEASASLTFMTIAFFVMTVAFVVSMFESVGPITLRQFDSSAASVYFIPLLSLYFGRRWSEEKYSNQIDSNSK